MATIITRQPRLLMLGTNSKGTFELILEDGEGTKVQVPLTADWLKKIKLQLNNLDFKS